MPLIRARTLILLTALLLLAAAGEHTNAADLTGARDLSDLDTDKPVILAFTADNCEYCDYVKKNHLDPMESEGEDVTIREVDVGSKRDLTSFSGETMEHRELGKEYDVEVTPTLVFLTPKGESVAENLVGVSSEDYYGHYLEERIESARDAMADE
ncbi:MAG: thioredoxin family protein [Thiohalospira sp.]|uniref:thioredoxin family protein n=1 Tax=Thiohalospira sp. TaxID=3080549 RepID=UPI00397F0498